MIVGAIRDLYVARWGEPRGGQRFARLGWGLRSISGTPMPHPKASPYTLRLEQVLTR